MLRLSDVKPALLREAHSPRHACLFEAARRRQPAFAPYPSPEAVLARLAAHDHGALAESDRLTCALLAEQQARPSALWSAVLVVAYFPMLTTLAGLLKRGRTAEVAVDELVLYAFLDAAHALPATELPGRALRRLRQVTRRAAFRRLREAREASRQRDVDADELSEEATDPGGVARWRREEADQTLRRLIASAPPAHRPGLDLLFATVLEGEDLAAYAARTRPDAPPEDRARLAAALKRTRSRALERLREGFRRLERTRPDPAPPTSGAEAL